MVAKDEIVPEEFNCLFTSVIAFGRAQVLEDDREKQQVLEKIVSRYSADFKESGGEYIKAQWDNVCAVAVTLEHMTGKKGV